jgi:uncharacterized repeat protein (TIGR03803 family)
MSRTYTFLFVVCLVACLISGAAPMAKAQAFSVVYNFGTVDGDPVQGFYSGVIAQGQDGNLYSGTSSGGINNAYGALFKITPAGALSSLYNFAGDGDGAYPFGGVTLGTDGNYYGTTYSGNVANPRYGTIFKMTPGGGLTTLYTFTDGNDGGTPFSAPVEGTDGNFYGTTSPWNGAAGNGAVYKITPSGTFTVLYSFDGTHGSIAAAPLLLGTDGNFYGTTIYGGTVEDGVVFKITPSGQLTVLHNLDDTQGDGKYPVARLVQGNDGNFYGTTLDGGADGYGVVFKITPGGQYTVLHDMNGTTDGGAPYGGMIQATDGNLYGANTYEGSPSTNCPGGCGTIFQITLGGDFSVLYNFDQTTGQLPYSTLFQHTNGLIYGMTQLGGTAGGPDQDPICNPGVCGVVYSLNIGAAPFITFVVPTAKVGTTAEILGQGFTGATGVSFNGTAASFTVVSDTYLTATVPSGARNGLVTVATPGGTLTSTVAFRVIPTKLATTTTTLTTSGSPSIINQAVMFTATVTSAGGSIPDNEAVTFYDGSTQIGVGSTASGVATFTTSTLSAKAHTIKATYGGDTAFRTSTGTVTQVVQLNPTTISVAGTISPGFGGSVTLTITVTNSGGPTPTGTVTVKNGSTTLGNATLDSTGTVIFTTTKLPVGTDSMTVTYNGDSQNAKSNVPFTEIVSQAQIILSLASTPNPSKSGKTVVFTATLTSGTGSLPKGQTVTFSFNGTTLGTGTISATGKAAFSTTALPQGLDDVVATYAGDVDYSVATNFVEQQVN